MSKTHFKALCAAVLAAPMFICGSVSAEKCVQSAKAVVVEQPFFEEIREIDEKFLFETAKELELAQEASSEPVVEQEPDIPVSVEWEWYDVVKETDVIEAPFYYDGAYALTESERDLVERTVMHEAGWCPDYRLLILTAQCIRNGCELFDQTPHETFDNFGYAAMSYANPRSKKAVSDVFDKGLKCVDDDIYCYYNSTMVASAWHETQTLSIDIDGNRFFY
ncbi:MAG: hypothetical protein MSH49_03800 [[Eubacterium] saphenum]|nr:hypothetical protein [[Eubacterium] saphenum]